MPAFDLTKGTLRYAASDETVVERATKLLGAIESYDPTAKQDATTALTALKHIQEHIAKKRKPAAANGQPPEAPAKKP